MMELAFPWALLAAPLPWLAWRLLPPAGAGAPGLRVPFLADLRALAAAKRRRFRRLLASPAGLAWALLLLAAAQPQWLGAPEALTTTGRDLMMVVDVSGSMRAMDFVVGGEPLDRLGIVKVVAGRFVERRTGDRLGLILFGSAPYLRAPLTYDRVMVRRLLEEAEIALAGERTALGDAVGLAIKRLRTVASPSRVAVVLTDGASNAGGLGPLQAASLAAADGIRLYVIGIGRDDEVAPNLHGTWSDPERKDYNRRTLEAMAEATGGAYLHALDAGALEEAYARLDALEPTLGKAARRWAATPLFAWPLAAALALSAWQATRRRR